MSQPLRDLELSLISGEFIGGANPDLFPGLEIVVDVISGKFDQVFNHPTAHKVLALSPTDIESSVTTGGGLKGPLSSYVPRMYISSTDKHRGELVVLAVGVACLQAFVQENWTGPALKTDPCDILLGFSNSRSPLDNDALNRKAVAELAFGGEPAYHLVKKASLLRFAQLIFELPYQELLFVRWWLLRSMTVRQQLLDEPVGVPDTFFAALDSLPARLGDAGDLVGRLLLEQGLLHHTIRNDRNAAQLFSRAARAFGLEYELTGALGKKTKFQQNEISQLVLLAQSRNRDGTSGDTTATHSVEKSLPTTLALDDDTLLEHTEFTSSTSASLTGALANLEPGNQPALHPVDQSVLLCFCLNIRNTQPLHGLTTEQITPYVDRVISHPQNWSVHSMALLLRSRLESTRSRTVERSTLQLQALIDQMSTSDSEPAERLLYIHDIPLPSTWELERELGMRYLSLGVVRSALTIFERLEMWEEVVKCYQALEQPEQGVSIVRDLLEGRKAEADIVLARGKSDVSAPRRESMDAAREAKLWCLLGDIEPQSCETHYKHAWEISRKASGRAARSMGGYHVARNEWNEAISWLRRAVAINPLLSRSWFLLGCACIREGAWLDARDAFARCVSINEDDAESWNNLASVYLQMNISALSLGGSAHSGNGDQEMEVRVIPQENALTASEKDDPSGDSGRVPKENKILAFRTLKHGLKFSYDNWRMWQNYMVICMEVGEFSEACRAFGRVVEELSEKQGASSMDLDILECLVELVVKPTPEQAFVVESDGNTATPSGGKAEIGPSPDMGRGLYPRVADLFTRVIIPRISSSPRVFRAYGKLLVWHKGPRWADEALDAYMSGYKLSVVDDESVGTDAGRWRTAVTELEDLIQLLRTLAPSINDAVEDSKTNEAGKHLVTHGTEGHRSEFKWQFHARSMVRSFMARTKMAFGDEPEWEKLNQLLQGIKSAS